MADFLDVEAAMSDRDSLTDVDSVDDMETAEDRAMIDDEYVSDDKSDVSNAMRADAVMVMDEAEREMQEAREVEARLLAQHGNDVVIMSTDEEDSEHEEEQERQSVAMPVKGGRQLTLSQMANKKRKRKTPNAIESEDTSEDEEEARGGGRPRLDAEDNAPASMEEDDDGDDDDEEARPNAIPRIPSFEHSGVYANKSVYIYSPSGDSTNNATEQPADADDGDDEGGRSPVRILSFKLPFDEDKSIFENKNRNKFMLFQAVYYMMCAAGHLCSKGGHLSTYLWVLKENSTTTENMMERVNRINFNKGKGHYLMEIHIEDDEALFQFTRFLEKGDVMFQRNWKFGGTTPFHDLSKQAEIVSKNPDMKEAVGHLYTSTTDLASGLVELAKEMGTILRNNPPVWARQAKVPDILKVATYQVQDTEPPELQSIEKNPNFWAMFSRENVFNALYAGNHQMQAGMAQALEDGQLFFGPYKAYPLREGNIRRFFKFTDLPGTQTYDLTVRLANPKTSRSWVNEMSIGNDDSTKDFHDMILEKKRELDPYEQFELAASYVVGKHVLLQPFEYNMRDFIQYIAATEEIDFQHFKGNLKKFKGFRVGAVYVDNLWQMIDHAEMTSKLHTLRMNAQFIHNMVFLVKPPSADVPGLMITGDAGGGKSQILNMLAKCGFGSMTDVKAWGSEQASFQKAPQQINVFHEGKPAHQNTNVANNEQKRTNAKQNFGLNNTFTVERMSPEGEVIRMSFKNRSKDFQAMNFSANLIDPALRDRNISFSSNKTMPPKSVYKDVQSCSMSSETQFGQDRLRCAHDEVGRLRFVLFNAYDILFSICSSEKDGRLAEWVSGRIKADLPKLYSQGVCNSRQNNYTRLFARVYALHTVVTALIQGIGVPKLSVTDKLARLAVTDSQKQVVADLRSLRDADGNIKPFMERMLTQGDWLCAEAMMFEGIDAILFGVGAQLDTTKEKAVDEVLRFIKIIVYKHKTTQSYDEGDDESEGSLHSDASEYVELAYGRDALMNNVRQTMQENNSGRSEEFINTAIDELDTRVITEARGRGSKGSKGIKLGDKNSIKIHRALLSTVLTPNEEIVINALMSDPSSSLFSESQEANDVFGGGRAHFASNQVLNRFRRDENVAHCFTEFDESSRSVNSRLTVTSTPLGGLWVSQHFVSLASRDNKKCAAHADFAKIMKTLGVSPSRGKFKISEPMYDHELTPGIVQYTSETDAFTPTTDVKIANVNYKTDEDRRQMSQFQRGLHQQDDKCQHFKKRADEDIELTENWKHFKMCEIWKRLRGKNEMSMRKIVFEDIVSLDAMQERLDEMADAE